MNIVTEMHFENVLFPLAPYLKHREVWNRWQSRLKSFTNVQMHFSLLYLFCLLCSYSYDDCYEHTFNINR